MLAEFPCVLSAMRLGVLLLLASGVSCVAPRSAVSPVPFAAQRTPTAATRAIHYDFRIDEALSTLDAKVCFEGAVPTELVCGADSGQDDLTRAFTETAAGTRELATAGHRIDLAGFSAGQCASYVVDLGSVADGFGGLDATRRSAAFVSNIALWLWRPPRWRDIPRATASFALPEGMRVSVPWPRDGERYVLDKTAFAFLAHAAFGRFEVEQIEVPGAVIEVVILDGLTPQTRAAVVPWISSAARMASLLGGTFPRDHAQVVVVPTTPSDEPVRFGMMTRGGGASMGVLLPSTAELKPLLQDWVAVHEFTHLFAPFVAREDAWLSEGLATYYQEVLRVRGGVLPEAEAWKRIYAGSQKGRTAVHSLAEESADMYKTFAFSMVYWAGASFALMADVELRRLSHGTRSLDNVMVELNASCSRDSRTFTAKELLARMDKIVGQPTFETLLARWVAGPALPDLSTLYAELGIQIGPDGTATNVASEASWIRDAIMRVHSPDADTAQ